MPREVGNPLIAITGCLGLFPVLVAGIYLKGIAIILLWGWFVTPTYRIDPPRIAVAVGISVLMDLLTKEYPEISKDPIKSANTVMIEAYIKILSKAPIAIGMGWVVKQFV